MTTVADGDSGSARRGGREGGRAQTGRHGGAAGGHWRHADTGHLPCRQRGVAPGRVKGGFAGEDAALDPPRRSEGDPGRRGERAGSDLPGLGAHERGLVRPMIGATRKEAPLVVAGAMESATIGSKWSKRGFWTTATASTDAMQRRTDASGGATWWRRGACHRTREGVVWWGRLSAKMEKPYIFQLLACHVNGCAV